MEKTDDTLQKRLAEETVKINVDSYQKTASLGGWAGGGRTLWAVSAVGAAMGAVVGAVAPVFPVIVGASTMATAVAALPASLAVFAATGMGMGFTGGLVLGRITGSNAAVAEEQERRMKVWTAKQLLAQSPDAKIVADEPKEKTKDTRSFWQKVKDNYHTYVNPRTGALFAVIGAVGGLIMAAAFAATGGATGAVIPAMTAVTGLTAEALTPTVMTAYTVGVMATFGALFSFNLPKVTSDATEFVGKLLSGKPLGREWGPKQPEIESSAQLS
ncbi:MAG: hypothetical protein ACK502_10860 [Alphaproteobacteria bacterium]